MEFESKIKAILKSLEERPEMTPDEMDKRIDEINKEYENKNEGETIKPSTSK